MNLDGLYSKLRVNTGAKLALVVLDGLGDIATGGPDSSTPLEAAVTPNLDALTQNAAQGRMIPVAPGITPGSGPGHLALFGYDPLQYEVGRGVLEALGIDFDLQPIDVAARANFCTIDENGLISDRRAGRIPTEQTVALCEKLRQIEIPGVQIIVEPVREHRFVIVFRGEGLDDRLRQTDPE